MSEDSRVGSSSEKLEKGPRVLSSSEKEFSKETKIVKKMKVFFRGQLKLLTWGQFSGLFLANHLHIWY